MATPIEQWFAQADYDFETAEAMYTSGRLLYAGFMAHLALEKALKGLYHDKLRALPPKTHDLVFLYKRISIEAPDKIVNVLVAINELRVASRYPDDLSRALTDFPAERVRSILEDARQCLQWIKQQS